MSGVTRPAARKQSQGAQPAPGALSTEPLRVSACAGLNNRTRVDKLLFNGKQFRRRRATGHSPESETFGKSIRFCPWAREPRSLPSAVYALWRIAAGTGERPREGWPRVSLDEAGRPPHEGSQAPFRLARGPPHHVPLWALVRPSASRKRERPARLGALAHCRLGSCGRLAAPALGFSP